MKKTTKMFIATGVLVLTAILGAAVAIAGIRPSGTTRYKVVEKQESGEAHSENILFLGMDREAGLTDVIMLVNINDTDKRMTVAQIPRDTYAEYTDASYKKLNGAYNSTGGAAAFADFLEAAMDIEIDHYACIGLDTFGRVVDAIGGVEVDLPIDMHYNDPGQGLYIDLEAGKQTLDGKTAEHFVRFRAEYADGDIGRIDAQKLFMSAFFAKLYDEFSPVMAAKLMSAAEGVETDISAADMLSVGTRTVGFGSENILFVTLPGREATAKKSGASYYVLSGEAVGEIMQTYFGGGSDFDSEGKFLNESYDEFEKIYNEYVDYTVNSVSDILRDGI